MAEEKVKVDIGRGSGGGSSGGGSSAGGSYSKSSSSGNSNAGKASTSSKSSSKASTGNSSSRYSGTANYSKAASNARTAVNNAKTRPRAGTSYVVNRESAKTASRQGGTYRGAINSPSAGKQGFGASGSMQGLQEGRESGRTPVEREQSVEDSHLQASILELARGAKGEAIKGNGTAYDYANQLIKLWNSGKDVVPVVKDGVVKWERGADRTGTRIFYDFDAKGNRIKTADKKLQDANNTAMWTDIDAWLNYANSGNLTRADNIKQSGRIAEYMRAIENGLMDNYDVEKQNGEKLSLYDYLGELFDLRDQLDVQARKQEGATALRYFAQQIDDVRTRMANGADYDVSKLGADYDSLLKYTSQYSDDEDFAELFTALSNDYYKVYRNGLQTQVGDLDAQLKAAQNAGLVAEQSVNSMNFNDVIVSDEDRQKIEANAEAARANTQNIFDQKTAAEDQLAWLDNEYRERNMTPEVAAAMERLSIAQLGKAYPDAHGKADAERMRQEDQALADEWNRSLELNPQYYNWQDRIAGVSKSFAARTAGSAANLAAWAANATTYENDEISEATQARDMAARAYLTDATPENKAALDAAEAALKQAQWNLTTWQTERTGVAPKLESVANSLDAKTQEEIAKAKEGASQLGQFGLDFLSTTMDMGFDALTGGGLKTMFARVAGSGIGEARRAGASSGEQLAYGLAQGAVEVFTEKLTDGLGAVYGKGISTDVVEKAISRLSSSDAGANFLRVLNGAIGEGGEEVVSDLLNPFTQWIIDEGARDNRVYDVDLSEALYDFLLGGAVGLVGQGGEVARGEYAAKNADIRQGDAEILEKAANAEATGQQLNSRDLSDLRAAQAREERQGVKGGLIIGPNGGLVTAPGVSGARSVTRGKNRHDTATGVLAEGFENAGYTNSTNSDDAYATATTGAQGPRTDAEADQQSYAQEIEAEAERQAEAEEARKAEEVREATRKENTELEEQARIREQETEGAKRAAQAFQDEQNAQLKAAQEAEKYAQLAHNAREFEAEQDFLRQAQQAKQAAEEAGRKAEEQLAMAESQSQAIESQDTNPTPAPANQEEANQEIAGSQAAALAGQDTSPVEAPQNTDFATASETALGAQATSTQANTQAEDIEAVKPTANEQGEVSASIATADEGRAAIESGETNNKTVAEVIPMVDKHVSESEPISTVAQNVFESRGSGKTPLSDRVANWIKSRFPTGVHSKAINGNVIVDKRGIKNDIAHGVGEAKAATFAAVPDVLDKGTIVSRSDGSVKGRSVTIAGKVMLNGSPVNVYCVVKQNSGDNRFYLHEVSDGNGTVFYKLGQNNNATPALLDSTGTNPASADVASTASIAQNPQAGNSTNSSTNVQTDGTITDEQRRQLDQFPKDISNEEANRYAEAASTEWPVYVELRSGAAFQYDGKQLWTSDEDGLVSNPREMSHDEFARNLEKWADSESYSYITFENSPIKVKGGTDNANVQGTSDDRGNGAARQVGRTTPTISRLLQRSGEVSRTLAENQAKGIKDEALRASYLNKVTDRYIEQGAKFIPEEEYTPFMQQITEIAREAGVEHVAFWWTSETSRITGGTYTPEVNALDLVFVNNDSGQAKMTLKHELTHNAIDKQQISALEDFRQIFEDAFSSVDNAEKAKRQLNYSYNLVKRAYARGSSEELRAKYTREQWEALPSAEKDAAINALPQDAIENLDRKIHEEFICEAIAGRTSWFFLAPDLMTPWQKNIRDYFAGKGYFSNELHGKIDALEIEFKQGDDGESPQSQQIGRTPGRIKQSQDVNRSRTATKGETKAQFENNGETDYISRTNAQRSQTADLLTEDADPKVAQQKKDEQVRRLLTEDYAWTDDDVVIAQKLMFDMVKGIRDYQLHRSHKMSKEAFKRMTDQYNQLRDKHTRTLSESGQTLQANYMFSTGDKIVMKAAQTFLGFTKDGRFAGGSVNAKNATIYAGVEEAAKRIQSAVDTKDVQGLAKICKDISNIRNVKKMFGPLGKFASEMESRVLDRIAKGENAAENLENLAYGNLNAVCDDVQPYKALNAAKTIRVMNMLSNTATIVNNLANNFAQGAVSKSMVNQALSNLASKPFEALTGQQVISKAQRGREANKAVRNAQAEALETATLMQMYGITEENGRLELNDRGMFNPNINAFEQTMSLYKFLTGMGVEATDKMQAAGILKSMELGIDADIKAGKIEAHTKEQRMQEARHEVNRLLYKDDNSTTALVQHVRDFLNKFHVGNDRVGTIGLGDITMAFAKIPANVVRARLAMTPEGALLQVAQYAKGVNKAKRMHAEVLAKGIVDSYREQIDAANTALQSAYEMERGPAKDAAIRKAQSELSRLNSKMWAEAQDACKGSVYKNLRTIAGNYNENMMFDEAVERAGYMNAKEMSQFEAAQLSRKIGRAATSAGMMALGSVLRALGALKDFDQEPDDELRKMNSDKGYRGLMMNLSAIGRKNHEWKDGDLVIDGEFLEVIAMPLTIGATAAEAAATAQDAKTWSWLKSMAGNGIAKTFEAVGDIPGMADAINMYESLTSAYTTDYDEKVSRLGAGLIQYAANTIPSFFMPNAVSQAAAGFDNKVRDVYAADTVWGQAKNIFMNKIPKLREKVPVSVDVWGNERTYGEGPWGAINKMLLPGDVHVYRKNKYEAEIERLVREGYGNAMPKTTVNSSFEVGDEKYTMTAQEKLDFKAARNSEQKELFEAFMNSKYYEQLNDAERMKVFQALKTSAERDAKQDMLDSRQLNVQLTRDKWETELLDVNDQIQFLTAKQLANNVLDRDAEDMDYAAVDQFLTGTYRGLSTTQRNLLNSSFSRLDDMYEAKFHYGISSETFNKGYDIYKDYMSQEGKDRVKGGYKDWEGSQMYTDIAKATGASEKQMDFFEDKFVLYNSNAVVPEKYNTLVDAGWGREAAQALVKNVADLTPTNGRKNVSYKQRLTAIATTSGLTEAQRWEAFYEYCPSSYTSVLKKMGKYRSNGFSLAKALKAAGKWDP